MYNTCTIHNSGRFPEDLYSTTKAVVTLSSGEAEFGAQVKGSVEIVFIGNIMKFWRLAHELVIRSDSSAARAMANRLGVGKRTKHLEVQWLWLQLYHSHL